MDEVKIEKKKKNVALIMIIILLILIILGLVGYICYDKGIIFKKKEEVKNTQVEKKKEEKEVEITDTTLINELNKKIYFINLGGYFGDQTSNYDMTSFNQYTFRNNVDLFGDIFNHFNNDLKLRIVLDSLLATNEFENLSDTNKNNHLLSEYINNYGIDIIKQISVSRVEEAYQEFFGTEVSNHRSYEMCFGYIYDKNSSNYFWIEPQCGGSTGGQIYTYKNRYLSKGNEAYVYVNYGIGYEGIGIYKDLNKNNLYKATNLDQEIMEFQINESNYQDFVEYKYTFKKDDMGNYYFVSLEEE